MKKKVYLLCTIAMLQILWSGAFAKDAYGYLTGSSAGLIPGLYQFDTENKEKLQLVSGQSYTFWGGAFAQGKYYCNFDPQGLMMVGWVTIDLVTGEMSSPLYIDYGCSDMTYDYSTSTMYGVRTALYGEISAPTLIKIDLANGKAQEVALLSDKIMALACTYEGEMYGIGSQANLYRIDKNDGTLTLIGNTGVNIREGQSLEFDHTDEQLYWSGLDNNYTTFLIKLDPETAQVESRETLQGNALLVGLYIPFKLAEDGAPATVTELTAQSSGYSVTLDWNNPVKTFKGEDLADLTRIEIYRNKEKIHSIENPLKGNKEVWTDNGIVTDGKIKYSVYAFNTVGRSRGASISVYVGKDSPSVVTELKVKKENDSAFLSWKAPLIGQNGGIIEDGNLKYTVVRIPGEKKYTDITETSFTDSQIEKVNNYSYLVTCYNELGESKAVTSDTLMIGPALETPYYPDFSSEFNIAQWTVFNVNGDNKTWVYNGTAYSYAYSMRLDADDWLISVPIELSANKQYRIKYEIMAPSFGGSVENFKITMGKTCDPVSQTINLEILEDFSCADFEKHAVAVTVDETGEYCLGMQVYSKKNQFGVKIKSFCIEPYGDNDLAVQSIEGENNLTIGKEYVYRISVLNNGKVVQKDYEVQLIDQDENIISSKKMVEELKVDSIQVIELTWTPEAVTGTHLYAKVVCKEDINLVNNLSEPLELSIRLTGEDWIEIGGKDSQPSLLPYGFKGSPYSYSETVYYKEEINIPVGLIKEMDYMYMNNSGQTISDKHIKIFMLNTEQAFINNLQWIPAEKMTLVYEGNLTFEKGENKLHLILDKPFYYTGENLCILNQKLEDPSIAKITFYAKNFPDVPRTAVINNDNGIINRSDIQFSSMINYLQLLVKTNEGGVLSGKVTYEGKALENAEIALRDRSLSTFTDEKGEYKLNYLVKGEYELDVYSHTIGIEDAQATVTVTEGESIEKDIELMAKPVYKLSGIVTGLNKTPIEKALVIIRGYDNYKVVTGKDGNFEIPAVYQAKDYRLEILTAGYKPYSDEFSVEEEDLILPEINLNLNVSSPTQVSVKEENKQTNVSWKAPRYSTEFKYDSGQSVSALELPDVTGSMLLGSAYPTPAIVNSVSWFTNSSIKFEHREMNLYVFALDEDGKPTNEVLFREEGIKNVDGKWNVYTLDDPVQAPRGYMVAVGFEDNISLAADEGADFASGCQYIIDYRSEEYYLVETYDFKLNLLLRANAMVYNPELPSQKLPKALYQLYRLKSSETEIPEKWNLLTAQPVENTSYIDAAWENLEDDDYTYAVKTVFENGEISEPEYSESIRKKASDIAAVTEETIRVYPNPASDYIYLTETADEVSLKDISGKEAYHNKGVDKICVTGFNDGFYLLKIRKDGKVIVRKIEIKK